MIAEMKIASPVTSSYSWSCIICVSSFTQVDFDDKRPVEHLQILNDILASLKPDLKADIRGAATRDEAIDDMRLFLMMHKCDCLPSEEVGFHTKETIYPILHWVLTEYEHLRKRTYLSRFLMPVDVPLEYMSTMNQTSENGNLGDLLEVYKQLQEEVRNTRMRCHHISLYLIPLSYTSIYSVY
jgi:hypothetical protein